MNYFELINKCLVELNYKKVNNFDELVKNDHMKIMNIINLINADVCLMENWNFLLRQTSLHLPANKTEIENTINGKIHSLSIDGKKYKFVNDFEKIISGRHTNAYSALHTKLLLAAHKTDKTVDIIYYTMDCAKDENAADKISMVLESDESQIPAPFAEPILVYGTCMRLKANPEYAKFNYWFGMYKEALANMKSKLSTSTSQHPKIILQGR